MQNIFFHYPAPTGFANEGDCEYIKILGFPLKLVRLHRVFGENCPAGGG